MREKFKIIPKPCPECQKRLIVHRPCGYYPEKAVLIHSYTELEAQAENLCKYREFAGEDWTEEEKVKVPLYLEKKPRIEITEEKELCPKCGKPLLSLLGHINEDCIYISLNGVNQT